MKLEYRSPTPEELESVLRATFSAFGEEMTAEEFAHEGRLMPVDRVLAAWHEGRPVGTAASWPFEITVPGGASLPAAGVTWCGVLPTHRRRGVLSRLMRAQLEDVHARGEPLALLWASEAPIYGRFGYGVAAPETTINAERGSFALRDASKPAGTVRLVSADEAVEVLPSLYESRRLERPGSLSRTADWWRHRLLADPEHWRRGSGPKFCALLELDGRPAGYALYRLKSIWEEGAPRGELNVVEAFATTPQATAELWRFLFGIDLVARVKHSRLDPSWSLFLMVQDPRRLHLSIAEGLWLRFVDLEAALRGRRYNDTADVVLDVTDGLLDWNSGRWVVGAEPGRTRRRADVAIGVADLASAYLGAFSFERLVAGGRAKELRPGGIARASALFATPTPPVCPEGF